MSATPNLRHPPLNAGWIDRPHDIHELGDLPLESGERIEDAHVCYVTHGELNRARDNAILVTTAIGATHHRLDFLIGPGRALDPALHFIVCVDALGNGLSISPSNSRAQPGKNFPRFVVRDMVASQARLLDSLGIERLLAVCGASLGGMQALQWAVSHPERVAKLVAMTPMARATPWSRVLIDLSRRALARPAPDYTLWAGLMRIVASRTPAALARMEGNAIAQLLVDLGADAAANGPDPLDWEYQTYAYEAHDVGTTPGAGLGVASALARVTMPALILAPALDLLNPAEEARLVAASLRRGRYAEIESIEGHQAASATDPRDAEFLNQTITEFLAG